MSEIRLAVTGGRDYHLTEGDKALLRSLLLWTDVLVHGTARGADSECAFIAECIGVPVDPFPAEWEKHGRAHAGRIRNIRMLKSGECGKVDILLAFPGNIGTPHCVETARRLKIPVIDAKLVQIQPESYWEHPAFAALGVSL